MTHHRSDDLDDLLTDAIAHRTASIEPASPDFETVLARHRRHARRVGTVAAVAVVAVGGVGVVAVASSSDSDPASDAHSAPATESTSPPTTVAASTTTINDIPATTSSTAPPHSEPAPPATYVLQLGDYPLGVANRHCMTGDELLELNGWTDFAEFPPAGTAVLVSSAPCPNPIIDYVITDGDSPETIAAKFCMSVDEMAAVNDVHDLDVYFRPDSPTGFNGQATIRVRDGLCET